jgi:hypothetical protein
MQTFVIPSLEKFQLNFRDNANLLSLFVHRGAENGNSSPNMLNRLIRTGSSITRGRKTP